MNIKEYIKQWAESYKTDLTENIMPFWMEHGWDKVNGGVYTCLNRDGSLIDSTKSVWFQGRFAFVCAYAYNNVEKNPMWLEAAKSTLDFIENHCFAKTEECTSLSQPRASHCACAATCSLRLSQPLRCRSMLWLPATRSMPSVPCRSLRTPSVFSLLQVSCLQSLKNQCSCRATASS